jgi:hypothetical protein
MTVLVQLSTLFAPNSKSIQGALMCEKLPSFLTQRDARRTSGIPLTRAYYFHQAATSTPIHALSEKSRLRPNILLHAVDVDAKSNAKGFTSTPASCVDGYAVLRTRPRLDASSIGLNCSILRA